MMGEEADTIDTMSDQLARFMLQQVVKEIPDGFNVDWSGEGISMDSVDVLSVCG